MTTPSAIEIALITAGGVVLAALANTLSAAYVARRTAHAQEARLIYDQRLTRINTVYKEMLKRSDGTVAFVRVSTGTRDHDYLEGFLRRDVGDMIAARREFHLSPDTGVEAAYLDFFVRVAQLHHDLVIRRAMPPPEEMKQRYTEIRLSSERFTEAVRASSFDLEDRLLHRPFIEGLLGLPGEFIRHQRRRRLWRTYEDLNQKAVELAEVEALGRLAAANPQHDGQSPNDGGSVDASTTVPLAH